MLPIFSRRFFQILVLDFSIVVDIAALGKWSSSASSLSALTEEQREKKYLFMRRQDVIDLCI